MSGAHELLEGLKLNNYHVIPAQTGAEALDACTSNDVDLILLGQLPDMSAEEVLQRLRDGHGTGRIAAGIISTRGAPSHDLPAMTRLGVGTFITKPFNLPIVIVQVESAIRNKLVKDLLQQDDGGLFDTAYTDPLTGLRNRRYLLERLQEEIDKSGRYDYPVSCVVFDIDEVVPVDAELGAVSLDDLLAEIGMALRNYSRTFDVVARYDGTVFAAVLPHAPLEDAVGYATKIMKEVESTTFADPNLPTQANLSVGVVSSSGKAFHGSDFVLGEAMRGLLQAKSRPVPRLVARWLSTEDKAAPA